MKTQLSPLVKTIRGSPPLLAVAGAMLVLAGCATAPKPPSLEVQAAESAIASAEQARVAEYAFDDLNTARQKLVLARTAVRDERMMQAEYLAIESRAHAEVALARSEELKAQAVNDEMRKSIETLRQEMNRVSGGRR